jgi:hypothetical protein
MSSTLFFAGDLEVGDLITVAPKLCLISTGTGEPERVKVPASGLRVSLVRESHPSDPQRILFKGHTGSFYDLPRSSLIRLAQV